MDIRRGSWGQWLLLGWLGGLALAPVADAQTRARAVPWASGELASYQVRLGGVGVGRGTLEVVGTEVIRGENTYHTRMTLDGGVPLARVHDRFESWIDTDGLFSRRFHQNQREARFR